MKNKLFTLIIILISTVTYCQESGNITGKFYILNIDLVVEEYNPVDTSDTNLSKCIAKAGSKFTSYEIIDKKLLIKFWKFKNSSTNDSSRYSYVSNQTTGEYFLISLEDFNRKTSEYNGYKHSFIWGFSTLPIKIRLKTDSVPFAYENSLALGINAGYEYQFASRTKQSGGILVGIGISTVAITPENVDNYIDKTTTVGAFSPSLGLIYSYESFQIGVFSGFDIIPGEMGSKYIYRNHAWLGLGLGFTIFQKNKTGNESENGKPE